ncbi:MAG TPA: sulfatase [Opitutaceae bacterium]|nr:sulfatase [Opitutaceae bacterium]
MKRIRSAAFVAALLALAAPAVAAERPRNVIVFLADDYGAMDLGAANPKTFYETPHLDRFAREGVRFSAAYSANPVCSPTRYSILTGKHPTRAGLTNFLPGVRVERFQEAPLTGEMPLAETTTAEALRAAGYRTAFVGKWHLGATEKFWPEAQGFEVNIAGTNQGSPPSYFSPYKNVRLPDGPPGEYLTTRLADETIKLLERFKAEGRPFLLHHHFYDVHTPLQAPADVIAKYRAKAAKLVLKDEYYEEAQHFISAKGPRRVRSAQNHAVYAAMIEGMDTALGRMLRKLDELGLAEDTLVIFSSDNGGYSTVETAPTSNLPLRAGKGWVYEGGIRIPFIIRVPGARPGRTTSVPVMTTDIFATVLDYAGVNLPAGPIDGRSLLPLLRADVAPNRDALYWHFPHYANQGGFPGGAIRMGDWKLVENYETGAVELYNLREDEIERNDRAAREPGRVQAMREKLHAWYHEVGAKFLRAKEGGPEPWQPPR